MLKNTAAFSTRISKISSEKNKKRCTLSRFFAFLINAAVLFFFFLVPLYGTQGKQYGPIEMPKYVVSDQGVHCSLTEYYLKFKQQ